MRIIALEEREFLDSLPLSRPLSRPDKEKIAHGNAERVLRM